jgi:predicted enzyme related to lactoylglutathione lyase
MATNHLKVWWHELNTWEPDEARHFYNVTLGWDFEPTNLPDGSRYWVAHQHGRAVGGIFQLTEPDFNGIPAHWMTYLAVDDIAAAQTRAEQAGGEILRPAFRLPGVGRLSVVNDTSGAVIGMIEPEGHISDIYSTVPVH